MTQTEATDVEILEGFLAEDGPAFRNVQGWVEGVVHLGRWHFEDNEAVVQDVLLKLLRITRGGAFQRQSSFKTFVFSVAKHTCIDIYRREKLRAQVHGPESPVEPADDRPGADRAVEKRERLELLRYVFQKLPDECRGLWKMTYHEGLSAAEAGKRLGITAGNVRVRSHRCLEKARAIGQAFHGIPVTEWE